MGQIKTLFPTLSFDNVRTLTAILVHERERLAETNRDFPRLRWSGACGFCEVGKLKLFDVFKAGTYPWLRCVQGKGMAYTVIVGGIPLRVQPDNDEIREVTPDERGALKRIRD